MSKARVVLVEPLVKNYVRVNKNSKKGDVGLRLSLGYLAGYLRATLPAIEVAILPYRLYSLEGVGRNIDADLCGFDVVGITSSTTEFYDALKIADRAKRLGKLVVVGGIFPSANADYALTSPSIDAVVRGEGERTFAELVESHVRGQSFEGILGLSYKQDGRPKHNPDRPFAEHIDNFNPAWDLMQLERYSRSIDEATIYASRGCNWRCSFCTINTHWRHSYRTRTIEGIVKELRLLREAGFRRVRIDDDSIFLNPKYGEALFRAIRHSDIGLEYRVKARVDEITTQRVALMRDAGVTQLHVGIESPTQQILNDVRKGLKAEKVHEAMRMIAQQGIELNPSFILGLPGEDEISLRKTGEFIRHVRDLQPNAKVYTSLLTAHPGTEFHSNARQRGIRIVNNDLDDYTHWMLTSIPDSLGDPFTAVALLDEVQRETTSYVGGLEPPLDVDKVLRHNPSLEHLSHLRRIS